MTFESAHAIAAAVNGRQQSAEETVAESLKRIEAMSADLNAFICVDGEAALQRARQIDEQIANGAGAGPLAGVPIAVKDNICTTSTPTTCGSNILKPFRSLYNAFVVDRLEAAGAIIVGKTNLDEFAMGSSTEHGAFGPTRNPWDRDRVAGGSSGGSAVAVAARAVPVALGSDTGGSIRQPASYCGITGLKPTYGRVSRFGLVAFGSSLDQIGPFATDARDAALLLNVIAGHDERDSTSIDVQVEDYPAGLDAPLSSLVIGVSEEFFAEGCDAEVASAVRAGIDALTAAGARVESVTLPHLKHATECYYIIAPAEASSNLARYDGVHYGHRSTAANTAHDVYFASRGEGFGPEVKRRIMLGTFVLSSGYYDAYYKKAAQVRTLIRRDFEQAFQKVDAIVSPVAPTTAFKLGEKSDDPLAMYLTDIYTIGANLAGIPAISVPCGFDKAGLPIGMQLMGRPFGEGKLLAAAHAYQQLTDHHRNRPLLASPS